MDAETRVLAEARLAEAAAAHHLSDPRQPLRERLRQLRERQPDAFSRAVAHYEEQVLPLLAAGEPLVAWLDYARFVGQLTSNGRLTAIDETGLAVTLKAAAAPLPGTLVLFVPEDNAIDTLVALAPAAPSPAQDATVALLVQRRLAS
jgi:hypothetical protein